MTFGQSNEPNQGAKVNAPRMEVYQGSSCVTDSEPHLEQDPNGKKDGKLPCPPGEAYQRFWDIIDGDR